MQGTAGITVLNSFLLALLGMFWANLSQGVLDRTSFFVFAVN